MIIHNPILTGSFTVNGTDVASITSSAASITAINAYTASQNILNGTYTLTSSFAAQTASFTAFTSSVNSFTASQLVLNGTYATTGSNTFAGIQTVNSNLVVTGSITAQTLVVQTITSSVDFVTGSTRFGSLSSNTHQFTGSMFVTGAFYVTTGSVGIGTTSPTDLLEVKGGNIRLSALVGVGPQFNLYSNGQTGSHVTLAQGFALSTDNIGYLYNRASADFVFGTSNTERMRITSSGSIGVAVTPSIWDTTTFKGIQIAPSNAFIVGRVDNVANQLQVGSNAYYNADGNWKFIQNGYATRYIQNGGTHAWDCSNASGTAGNNVTFITPLTIASTGAATFSSSVTANKFISTATDDGIGQYFWFTGNAAVSNNFSVYAYSNNVYINAYQTMVIRANQGTTGGSIQLSGGVVFVGGASITNSGSTMNVIGTSTSLPLSRFFVNVASSLSVPAARFDKYDNNTTTSQVFIDFTVNNQASGNGSITGNGASQVTFTTWSDIRLKENITNLPSQLLNIMALRPVEFDYKDGSGHQIGFIAQEVQEIYPDIVGENAEGYLTISGLSKMESRLIKAIQELQAQITELKNK